MNDTTILSLESIFVEYRNRQFAFLKKTKLTHAVDNISFTIKKGEIFGIVGESGSGKSSLMKAICKMIPIKNGKIFIEENDVTNYNERQFLPYRKKVQMISQDFCETFNPLWNVFQILSEPIDIHFPELSKHEKTGKIKELLSSVELNPSILERLPQELSGGQRQRLSIARALAVEPSLLICDEIVSACDMYTQKQILKLLKHLNASKGIAILFISHNIAVIANLCQNVIVMKNGKVIEMGDVQAVCSHPSHKYTELLLASVPHLY